MAQAVRIPFLDGMSLYSLLKFFFTAIVEGSIGSRASSVAFSFFMALFPGILFLFTLIPYVPIENFQSEVFRLLHEVVPPNSYSVIESTIQDVLLNKNSGLLSFGFIAAMVFATNGTNSLLSNFGMTVYNLDNVKFIQQYISSLLLTVVFSVVFLLSISALVLTNSVTQYLVNEGYIPSALGSFIEESRWILIIGILFVSISTLYYWSPLRKNRWNLFSFGALLATGLMVASSSAFRYYVENFNQYNKLYGSIGTLMIILLWIYLNAFIILIGFELNMSISAAKSVVTDNEQQIKPLEEITKIKNH
jgi:membrane protein